MDKRFSTIPEPLWQKLQLLIPPPPPRPTRRGRPRNHDRVVVSGIIYRLRTGCQWRAIPPEFGSGQTCHRPFQEWERQGVFQKLFICMLHDYDHRRGIQWQWGALDSVIAKAPKGGSHGTEPNGPGEERNEAARLDRRPRRARQYSLKRRESPR
jgi:transposase